jgi:hypothetical protein
MRLNRKTTSIDIENKRFEITVIPIGALILWDEINEKSVKMDKLLKKMIVDAEKQEAGTGRVNPKEYEQLVGLMTLDIEKPVIDILRMILAHEANDSDFDFDKSWWLEHMGESRGLIEKAITKDGVFTGKKQKVDWDMLYSMINKHWRAVTWKEFFDLDVKEIGNIVRLFPSDSGDLFLEKDSSTMRIGHVRYD